MKIQVLKRQKRTICIRELKKKIMKFKKQTKNGLLIKLNQSQSNLKIWNKIKEWMNSEQRRLFQNKRK